jgi:hypothetical protein
MNPQEMLEMMRQRVAGGPPQPPQMEGLPEGFIPGEGKGKISPEELEVAKQIIQNLNPQMLQAIFSLPKPELVRLLTRELKDNNVDDVDVPDIVNLILAMAQSQQSTQGPPVPQQ